MKTKIAILLVVCGIIASFGATKIKTTKSQKEVNQISSAASSEPKGGFVSEEH